MSENTLKKIGVISVSLDNSEWLFVQEAIRSWVDHVLTIEPTEESVDDWSDMTNDALRLKVILSKITEQT